MLNNALKYVPNLLFLIEQATLLGYIHSCACIIDYSIRIFY